MWNNGVQRIALWGVLLLVVAEDAFPRLEEPARQSAEDVCLGASAARRQSSAVDDSTPSLITLHLKDAAAQSAYHEVARQAQVTITALPATLWTQAPTVSIDVEQQPFWRVMQQLAVQTGLAPGSASREGEIPLHIAPRWATAPSYYRGCVLFVADSVNINRRINYTDQQQAPNNMSLSISAYTDPKIDVLQMRMLRPDEAVDQNGHPLVNNQQPGGGMAGTFGGPWRWEGQLPLQYLPGISNRIARLKGSVRFVLCTKRETWEVADIRNAKDVVRVTPLATYTIKGLEGPNAKGHTYQLKIQIKVSSYTSSVATPSGIQQAIRLIDASGQAYTRGGGGGGGSGGPLEYRMGFTDLGSNGANLGPPVKLIWGIPVETKELIVPIELNDLPLPATGTPLPLIFIKQSRGERCP